MPIHRSKNRQIPTRKLFISEWIARLGRKSVEIAKAAGITESYLSELAANKKDNPSGHVLLLISEELRITVNDLYRAPPTAAAVEAAGMLSPAETAALGTLLSRIKPRSR